MAHCTDLDVSIASGTAAVAQLPACHCSKCSSVQVAPALEQQSISFWRAVREPLHTSLAETNGPLEHELCTKIGSIEAMDHLSRGLSCYLN